MLGAVLWRTLFFEYQTHNYQFNFLDTLRQAPLATLQGLGATILRDIWQTAGLAWLQTLHLPDAATLGRQTALIAWGLLLLSAVLIIGFPAAGAG